MAFTHGNILAVFFSATKQEITAGKNWYSDAHSIAWRIACDYDLTGKAVAGAIAALSPNNKWERNCIDADNLARVCSSGGDPNSVKVSTYGDNKKKAIKILTEDCNPLEILGGYKVRAFYNSIIGYGDDVCVDGHVYSYWIGDRVPTSKTPKISAKLYATIAEDHRIACKLINSTLNEDFAPSQIQAICWLVWRRINKGARA